ERGRTGRQIGWGDPRGKLCRQSVRPPPCCQPKINGAVTERDRSSMNGPLSKCGVVLHRRRENFCARNRIYGQQRFVKRDGKCVVNRHYAGPLRVVRELDEIKHTAMRDPGGTPSVREGRGMARKTTPVEDCGRATPTTGSAGRRRLDVQQLAHALYQ